jgi:formylglycine-generating enzyme required for sulfatase activity
MSVDLQFAVVSPFNTLKKQLSEWLDGVSSSSYLPPTLRLLVPEGSASSLVAPALSADLLRLICDSGFGEAGLDSHPERTALLTPLAAALLKQLQRQKQYHVLEAFRSDADPLGYQCGSVKWAGGRMCAKATASTGDETFVATYLSIVSSLASFLECGESQVHEVSQLLERHRYEKPFESVDGLPSTVVNSLGMRLVLIPPGEFIMGASPDDKDADTVEEMPHDVRITRPFYLGVHQVTQEHYEQVMGDNPSMFRGRFRPVEHTRWQDAVDFCKRLSQLPAEREAGREYRLPTEAEWEYACRAGTSTTFSTGERIHASQACLTSRKLVDGLSKPTKPVGSYPPNQWGLYDMHGNVWEWCGDWFGREYYSSSPLDDPRGPDTGTHHVLRGGSASLIWQDCRSSSRGEAYLDGPSYDLKNAIAWYGDIGVRVACHVVRSS